VEVSWDVESGEEQNIVGEEQNILGEEQNILGEEQNMLGASGKTDNVVVVSALVSARSRWVGRKVRRYMGMSVCRHACT